MSQNIQEAEAKANVMSELLLKLVIPKVKLQVKYFIYYY